MVPALWALTGGGDDVGDRVLDIGHHALVPDMSAVEDEDGWCFAFVEDLVTQLRVDHRFTLLLENGIEIVVEEPFTLRGPSGFETVPPGEAVYEVQAALPLFNQRVTEMRASRVGALRVAFDGGYEIEAAPNPAYESWQVAFPDGRMWVGAPGGDVVVFPARP